MSELNMAIKSSSASTAPGFDNIHYEMIRQLPSNKKTQLLNIYNKAWLEGNFPEDWKDYVVMPILKKGKNPEEGESYRPIALSSCVFKTFERLIKIRLEWWLEYQEALPESQYGFRRNRSTTDAQVQLVMDVYDAFTNNKTVLGLFLDIQGAYDSVQFPILFQKMINIGLPVNFSERVISFLDERNILLRVNGAIIESRTTQLGLPQGSILSPLLYAIYVADLESMMPSNVKIIQYADDICVYSSGRTISECQRYLNLAMGVMDEWMDLNGLTISEAKSVVCPFNRSNRLDTTPEMILGRNSFPCNFRVRFLGLIIDRKLYWKGHINHLIGKTEGYLNVLRTILHARWGADPALGLLIYRATVRSIIDFGSVLYGQARKSLLKKLDYVQHRCLRLCLGSLKSTPIDVLLAESSEAPLYIRRSVLTDKYMLRLFSTKNKLLNKINSVTVQVLTKSFWNKKISPPLVESFTKLSKYRDKIQENSKLPLFETNFRNLTQIVHTEFIEIGKGLLPSHMVNTLFLAEIRDRWPSSRIIYSDGSKSGENVGCAWVDPKNRRSGIFKLPGQASIFTAENIAILQALKYIKTLSESYYIIVCDSKSTVIMLGEIGLKKFRNNIIVEILDIYTDLIISGKKIILLWTAAHNGIAGNEEADHLAKRAAVTGDLMQMKIPASDMISVVKEEVLSEWQRSYTNSPKGGFFKCIHPSIKPRPWFAKVQETRMYFTTIIRLRCNHAVCGAYLHKIGRRSTDLCHTCDEREDMEHIVMVCSRFERQRRVMWEELCKAVPLPFSYLTLLQDVNAYEAVYKLLVTTEAQRLTDYLPTSRQRRTEQQ